MPILCVYVSASGFTPGYECGGQKPDLGSQLRVWTQVMRSGLQMPLFTEPTRQPWILFKASIDELNNHHFRVDRKSWGGMLKILTALLNFCRAKKISYEKKKKLQVSLASAVFCLPVTYDRCRMPYSRVWIIQRTGLTGSKPPFHPFQGGWCACLCGVEARNALTM